MARRAASGLLTPRLAWVSVAAATALTGLVGAIGADCRWFAALGGDIVRTGVIPRGVPYAASPSAGWHNVPVAAEIILHGLDAALGSRGLLLAQVVAVGVTFAILLLDARAGGAGDRGTAIALALLLPTAFTAIIAVRVQLFSLPLVALTIALLRAEHRAPSRRIWLLVPLAAVWSNLHGGVLTGLAIAFAYLLLDRGRAEPILAAGVAVAMLIATFFLTPALLDTPSYYLSVLSNEAAARGVGLWQPLSLSSGFDLVFLIGAAALLAAAVRARPRPPLWEIVAFVGLAALTVRTARGGVFAAFLLAAVAARGLGEAGESRPRLAGPVFASFALLTMLGVARGPLPGGASQLLLRRALAAAGSTPVLADDLPAEQLVLAGGHVWVANPLDAFGRADQRLYLDWTEGRPAGDAALAHAPRAALVLVDGKAERRLRTARAWREAAHDSRVALYVHR